MASPASAKKQIVESIKDKTAILVTVSNNPSVDELSAALGLTIFLNKLGNRHATAVVSGQIPSTLDFLDPNKTFEASADSLRDFIISLDKEKADHLRYKVDGDVVKIFITPYRTTITSQDLEFSQGDYNVELVLALNVANSEELDAALTAHGKILHDATVATITAGEVKSDLGTIDWREPKSSSVSEMVSEIIQELKTPKAALDEQIATALLTGIVASTERFSNDLTSPRVMTIAAELMAAGANQQLIAAQLQPEAGNDDTPSDAPSAGDGTTTLEEGSPTDLKIDNTSAPEPAAPEAQPEPASADSSVGIMKISHAREGDIDDIARQVQQESQADAARAAEAQLDQLVDAASTATPASTIESPVVGATAPVDIATELQQATDELSTEPTPAPGVPADPAPAVVADETSTPTLGGTLNATTAQAADDKRREIERDQNRTILTHGKPIGSPDAPHVDAPMNAAMATQTDEPPLVDIFAAPPATSAPTFTGDPAAPLSEATSQPSVTISDQQAALSAVDAALAAQPEPATIPDAPVNAAPSGPTMADLEAGVASGLPPMPDFSSLPELPPAPTGIDFSGLPPLPATPAPPTVAPPQSDFNPNQFQIPPQQ